MARSLSNSRTLINNIKRELKRQKLSYADLAEKLGVAESTVKKMFAKGNFSLDRLDHICEALKVDLLEMVENVNEEVTRVSGLTISQERKLVEDPKLLLISYAAVNFWTVEDMLHRYDQLTEEEVIERLKILQGFGLLELRANNRIPDADADGDTVDSSTDENDLNKYVCLDSDLDLCDDCSSGSFNILLDGLDTDSDGLCDLGDDNDLVIDAHDNCPLIANADQSFIPCVQEDFCFPVSAKSGGMTLVCF